MAGAGARMCASSGVSAGDTSGAGRRIGSSASGMCVMPCHGRGGCGVLCSGMPYFASRTGAADPRMKRRRPGTPIVIAGKRDGGRGRGPFPLRFREAHRRSSSTRNHDRPGMWGKKEPELPPRHPLASYLDQTQAKSTPALSRLCFACLSSCVSLSLLVALYALHACMRFSPSLSLSTAVSLFLSTHVCARRDPHREATYREELAGRTSSWAPKAGRRPS